MTTLLLTLSTLFLLIAPISYAVSILRGNARPHRLTRLALMAELLLTFASVYASGANPGVLLITGISAIHGVVIFGLSLWRGMGVNIDDARQARCVVHLRGSHTAQTEQQNEN